MISKSVVRCLIPKFELNCKHGRNCSFGEYFMEQSEIINFFFDEINRIIHLANSFFYIINIAFIDVYVIDYLCNIV